MSNPLKVIFVINGLGTGGAERSLAEMLPRFVQAGIHPILLCFYHRAEGVEDAVMAQGYDVRFCADHRLWQRVATLRRLIQQEKPNIVHTALFEANLVGRLACIGLDVKLLNSLVNTPYTARRANNIASQKLMLVRWIDAITARYLGAHFHAITEAVKWDAVETLKIPADRIDVVERGRNVERLGTPSPERRMAARRKLGFDEGDQILVNVARQEYQKGQSYLLDALSQLQETHPRLTLLIIGRNGAVSDALQAQHARLNLGDRVRFLGHRDDVPDILSAADLFVFPSLWEGLGGALLEAMALGLPIVASDIPVLREVVEADGNAMLVEPASASALAIAISRLLNDPQRVQQFSSRSQSIFQDRFRLETISERMVDLYRKLADETQSAQDPTSVQHLST
ncbi:glycosyltransferase [bacterium]|nr:glycosyltransferase [bacterium]